ncbi:MAG: AAA family ATPase, partial [Alphaproteobacteria bacterium]|nr:AAA family ATPase [Alphaproteobacteria bacterium]
EPMALIRAILRRKVSNLKVVGSAHGIDVDLLCGAGAVSVSAESYVGFEQDFGMALPEFQTEDEAEPGIGAITTPEAYFDAVTTMAAQRKGWRVRRFGTFAPFTFGNIAIFHDLAPENWPGDAALEQRPLIAGLLGGRQLGALGDGSTDDTLLEDRSTAPAPLVMDADASQYAIVHAAAIHEQDLAVQGPPGTGKSQTIVNLIAAALHQGKRVLFVAEKAAALDVVAKRLESVGLGEFCMDLHGPGARREEVLADLKARIDASAGPGNAARLKQALDEANRLKTSLTAYANAINTEHGSLGLTVHDIIWKEQATRTIDLPTAIDDITLEGAAGITPYVVDEAHDLLNRIAAADQSFRADHGSPDAHPWRPIGETAIPQHQRQTLVRLAGAWRQALEALIETEAGWRGIGIDPPASPAALRAAVQGAAQLPAPDPDRDPAVDATLFTTLNTPEAQSKLREYLEAADHRTNALSVLATAFEDVEAAKAQNGLAPLAAALESLIGERPVSALNGIEQRRLAEAAAWDGVTDHARQFIQAIGVEEPGNSATAGALRRALAAAAILRDTPPAALLWRLAIAGDRDATAAVHRAMAERDVVLASKQQLETETGISLDHLGDAQAIANDQASCRAAGFMAGLFDSNFKAARLRARGAGCIAKDKATLVEAFGKALTCRKQETAFTNDPAHIRQLHSAFQGMDTDFDGLLAAATVGDAIRAAFGGFEPEAVYARQVLLGAENGRFADIRDAARGADFDTLQQAAEALKDAAPATPLADISDTMRQDAAHTAGFIQRVQEIGLRP